MTNPQHTPASVRDSLPLTSGRPTARIEGNMIIAGDLCFEVPTAKAEEFRRLYKFAWIPICSWADREAGVVHSLSLDVDDMSLSWATHSYWPRDAEGREYREWCSCEDCGGGQYKPANPKPRPEWAIDKKLNAIMRQAKEARA